MIFIINTPWLTVVFGDLVPISSPPALKSTNDRANISYSTKFCDTCRLPLLQDWLNSYLSVLTYKWYFSDQWKLTLRHFRFSTVILMHTGSMILSWKELEVHLESQSNPCIIANVKSSGWALALAFPKATCVPWLLDLPASSKATRHCHLFLVLERPSWLYQIHRDHPV